MQKLDKKDYKILFELDKNARQTNTQIAKKVRLSKDSVGYRISKLEDHGIISGYRTLIDFSRLGYISYRTLIKFIDINEQVLNDIKSYLRATKGIWGFGKNEGEWDFAFVYLAKTNGQFYSFYEKFASRFRKVIGTKLITQFLEYVEVDRTYLINTKSGTRKKLNFDKEIIDIDSTDSKILNILSKNSRIKLIDISEKLKLSSMLIYQRIKKLEKNGVIIGYKLDLDVLAIGRDYYGVKMNLSNYSEKEKILEEIYSIKEMTAVLYHIGGYDIEFDLEIENTQRYHEIIKGLRNKFSSIRDIRSMRAIEYYISGQELNLSE
jgi:Lrp/AsnC family transcriptional regulator, leucine-responsive regulatory protein